MIKWSIELGEFDIKLQSRQDMKAQVLANFLIEGGAITVEDTLKNKTWMLYIDGSSTASKGKAGIFLQGLDNIEVKVALRLDFEMTNNEAEYKALIARINLAQQMKVKQLVAYTDLQLVAM